MVLRHLCMAVRPAFCLLFALMVASLCTRSPDTARADDSVDNVPAPTLEWTLHEGRYWEVVSPKSESPALTDAAEGTTFACAPGMVEVRGSMKAEPTPGYIEAMQRLACAAWISMDFPDRCLSYDQERWRALIAAVPSSEVAYCIDRFEYPNARGAYPWVFVTWDEASQLCRAQGKRLCSEEEWTFACEGEEAQPYPYGYTRSAQACVIDRPHRPVRERALAERTTEAARRELDSLWQGEPAGSRPYCRSPFGVYDMTGNVDEWTTSTSGQGYPSILKGGYWGQVRNRCRPSTRAHGPSFAYYQQGFRCCADVSPDAR